MAFVKQNFLFISRTSNQVYVLRNYFSNCIYPKDMYIILKAIGKILFVSVLTILLISKFLKFTAFFTNKKDF